MFSWVQSLKLNKISLDRFNDYIYDVYYKAYSIIKLSNLFNIAMLL